MKEAAVIYLTVINIISVFITIFDKRRAKNNGWRVKEFTLLLISLLGGAVSMYITMKLIRHKTKKKKFMWGIPLIFLFQAALIVCLIYFYKGNII